MSSNGANLKQWARERLIGVENVTMPSFTPDLTELDEDGIRWDVRQAKAHGFSATMCACETGLTLAENKRFVEIVCDEAGDDLLVSLTLLLDSFEQIHELAAHAEGCGATHALIGYPPNWRPAAPSDIYDATREICAASGLGIVLYATDKFDFARFHPSQVPFEVYDRMVELDAVVGFKVGFVDPAMTFEAFRRYSDRIQVNIGTPWLVGMFPLLRKRYHVQWFGGGAWEFWQSPDKPYLVDYYNQVMSGDIETAMKTYWRFAPATQMVMRESIGRGGDIGMYNWPMGKYISWTVGGNGGLTRQPAMRLTSMQMQGRKMALRAIGIDPPADDAEFFLGRAEVARRGAPKSAV